MLEGWKEARTVVVRSVIVLFCLGDLVGGRPTPDLHVNPSADLHKIRKVAPRTLNALHNPGTFGYMTQRLRQPFGHYGMRLCNNRAFTASCYMNWALVALEYAAFKLQTSIRGSYVLSFETQA